MLDPKELSTRTLVLMIIIKFVSSAEETVISGSAQAGRKDIEEMQAYMQELVQRVG